MLGIGVTSSGKPEGVIGEEGESENVVAPSKIDTNVWTHLAFTYDGAHMRLYVNGALVATQAQADAPLAAPGDLKIGCSAWWWEEGFNGKIDEVRIYDRALTDRELESSMFPAAGIETSEGSGVHDTNAVFTGTVNPHGADTTYWFEYGTTIAYGHTGVSGPEEGEEVVSGDEPLKVAEAITGLEPETTYHYRIVATNDRGTVVGRDRELTTEPLEFAPAAKSSWEGVVGLNWAGSLSKTARLSTMTRVNESKAKMFRVVIGSGEPYDKIFRNAAIEGITILPNIVGVQGYGNLIPPQDKGKSYRLAWQEKLQAIVGRYGYGGSFWKGVEEENKKLNEESKPEIPILVPNAWEIWNEPNTGKYGSWPNTASPGEPWHGRVRPGVYGDLLAESATVIHGVPGNGSAKVLMGGLLSVNSKRPDLKAHPHAEDHMSIFQFIEDAGHINAYDILSVHPYAFRGVGKRPQAPTESKDVKKITERVQGNLIMARAALDSFGTTGKEIPMWATEFGWPVKGHGVANDRSHFLVDEDMQRDLLTASFEMMKGESSLVENVNGLKINHILYYNLEDWVNELEVGADPTAWDLHCGLVEDIGAYNEHGAKRKAWNAFQAQAE